jgi:nitroimidazol reductase NimA-like FMN-containing flavoprotein (pyridoxamine 5'-phosphate oxidase superfamily)
MADDEPLLGRRFDVEAEPDAESEPTIAERIGHLLDEQQYGVLCTQGGGQPYGSLVAFASTDDLQSVVFATPVTTRKFRLLSDCDHVALLIDSRARSTEDMMAIEAVTATGRAARVQPGPEFERWANLLTSRHPHLAPFVKAPTSAVFLVTIYRYFHVSRFQEVRQWSPQDRG